ncbi:MAG: hypothetical protein ACXADC_02220 [Candidatus Thorarchaeota archaeon]
MGVRERRREKEKTKSAAETSAPETTEEETTPVEETKMDVESIHRPDVVVKDSEATSTVEETETAIVELEAEEVLVEQDEAILMPPWGDLRQTEWMYGIPPREEDREMWAEEWSDFVLRWMEAHDVHVLSVTAFIKEPPFNDITSKTDSFKLIGEVLVQKEIAEWLDRNRRQLRVYWRFLEDWTDIIYEWALKSGKTRLDVKSIVIQEDSHSFAKLPEKDLHRILFIMVEKGIANWVDKKKGAVKIIH